MTTEQTQPTENAKASDQPIVMRFLCPRFGLRGFIADEMWLAFFWLIERAMPKWKCTKPINLALAKVCRGFSIRASRRLPLWFNRANYWWWRGEPRGIWFEPQRTHARASLWLRVEDRFKMKWLNA